MRDVSRVPIIDVECTCYEGDFPEGEKQEIIEIGAALLNLRTLEIERVDSLLIAPKHSNISAFCTKLTTLTPDTFKHADLTFDNACRYLETAYDTRNRPWASWGDFDRRMFREQCAYEGVTYPFSDSHLNLRVLFSLFVGEEKRLSMPAALNKAGLPLTGTHHRGVDDAVNIARLFSWIVNHRSKL